MDERTAPAILVVDDNPTVLKCVTRAFEVVGVAVETREELPAPDDVAEGFELLVFDCSRATDALWDTVRAWSSGTNLALLPITVRPEDFPADMMELRGVEVPLDKPFTPFQICSAAFEAAPAVNVAGGPPPFPREPPTPLFGEEEVDVELESSPDVSDLLRSDLGITQASEPLSLLNVEADDASAGDAPISIDGAFQLRGDLGITQANDLIVTAEGVALDEMELSRGDDAADSTLHLKLDAKGSWHAHEARTVEMTPMEREDAVERMATAASSRASSVRRTRPLLANTAVADSLEPERLFAQTDSMAEASISGELERMLARLDDIEVASLTSGLLSQPDLPRWAETLASLWPALARESLGPGRAQLIAATLAHQGLAADAYWIDKNVVEDGKQRLAVLKQAHSFHGDLNLLGPFQCLEIIRERGLRGTLEVGDPFIGFRLVLNGDVLVRLEPRIPRTDLLLGRVLANQGALGIEAIDQVAEIGTPSDATPLGALLVSSGLIDAETLERALLAQVRGYFLELASMRNGQFLFREWTSADEVRSPSEGLEVNFRASHLTMDLLRTGAVRGQTLTFVPDLTAVSLVANNVALLRFGMDSLTQVEQDVLARLADGPTSLASIEIDLSVAERLFCMRLIETMDGP